MSGLAPRYFREPSPAEGFKARLAAAEAGDKTAQNDVGMAFLRGEGVATDYKKAKRWLEKASSPSADANLAHMYLEGLGVTPSMVRAGELLRSAQEQGADVDARDLAQLASVEGNVRALEHMPYPALPGLGKAKGPKIGGRVVIAGPTAEGRHGTTVDFGAWCFALSACPLFPLPSAHSLRSFSLSARHPRRILRRPQRHAQGSVDSSAGRWHQN